MASLAAVTSLVGFGSQVSPSSAATTSNPYHLLHPGTLTVGMNLADKPEMYLTPQGKPAGYDVVLIHALAKALGLKLSIDNLAWSGLIPGLEAKKFDIVSSGLDPTAARQKVMSFTRAYVPYQIALAVPYNNTKPATVAAWSTPATVITAQAGTVDQDAAEKAFPKASVKGFPDADTAIYEVATGRANAAVVETYLISAFSATNPKEIKGLIFPSSLLPVYYAAYAIQKGNSALVNVVNKWICSIQANGFMAKAYKSTEGSTLPKMPACS
jgi:ABC-type amino acid transport substrate-binding protein